MSQRLARFQPTSSRANARRIVSSDRTVALSPCSCTTCASRVSVRFSFHGEGACDCAGDRAALSLAPSAPGRALGPREPSVGPRPRALNRDGVAHGRPRSQALRNSPAGALPRFTSDLHAVR